MNELNFFCLLIPAGCHDFLETCPEQGSIGNSLLLLQKLFGKYCYVNKMWWSIYSECPRETTVVNFQKRGIQDIWCGALRCKSEALPKTCNSFILIALWFIFQSVSISEGLLFVITSDRICCQKPGRDIMFERGSKQFLPVWIWPYHTKDQSSFHHITSFTQLFKTFVLLWCINIPLRETENPEKDDVLADSVLMAGGWSWPLFGWRFFWQPVVSRMQMND